MPKHKIGSIGQHENAKRFVLDRKAKRAYKKLFRQQGVRKAHMQAYSEVSYYTTASAMGRDYCRYILNKLQ